MSDVPRENIWCNGVVRLISHSQQNVVFRCHGDDAHTYFCPLSVWMVNPLSRNLKPVE